MQTMVPDYLEAAMANFSKNQTAFKDAFGSSLFADLAKRQMALFEQSAKAFTGAGARPARAPETNAADSSELDSLKAELDALRAKVDRLGH